MGSLLDDAKKKQAAQKPAGWGAVAPGAKPAPAKPWDQLQIFGGGQQGQGPSLVAPGGGRDLGTTSVPDPATLPGGGGGGGGGGSAAAKASSRKANEATAALADQQRGLIDAFAVQRDAKLQNILGAFASSDALMLQNYGTAFSGLEGNKLQNEQAEADASFGNIANAVRERASVADQAASQGAGETDLLRAQLQALRNYSANQGEVNRSYHDTATSINNSMNSLNTDTATSRTNLFNQAESDRESAWANYANQTADAWTQIMNIESANTNVDSDSSAAYTRKYGDAGKLAADAVRNTYTRQGIPAGYTDWAGKGQAEERKLTSGNRAAAVNLGGPRKAPEGATLRKWE